MAQQPWLWHAHGAWWTWHPGAWWWSNRIWSNDTWSYGTPYRGCHQRWPAQEPAAASTNSQRAHVPSVSTGSTPQPASRRRRTSYGVRGQADQPWGAGIIAFRIIDGVDHVCICKKGNEVLSFPKGSIKYANESVIDCARREWQEEAGISLQRLSFLHNHQALVVLNDRGCRYFVAHCEPPNHPEEPDMNDTKWKPRDDPYDKNPIVESKWTPVNQALHIQQRVWSGHRVALLRQALEMPWRPPSA